jgi:curved DNA-binding protein CbpA
MRFSILLLSWAFTLPYALAWDKDDHEIFRLRDEVMKYEGQNVTFYDFIGVKPSASQDDINKAYRKKSRLIHPDKARAAFIANYASNEAKKESSGSGSDKDGKKKSKPASVRSSKPSERELSAFTKEASARFARLGLIAKVLRGPGRDRYDHFLKNGFPLWRGTGYYYERFRPGAGSVLVGLFVVCGGAFHYCALYLSWKRQRDFVERYIRHARRMAWGDELGVPGIPGADGGSSNPGLAGGPPVPNMQEQEDNAVPWNRREKRRMEKENRKKSGKALAKAKSSGISTPVEAELTSGTPRGAKKRVVAENGKVLIVDSVGNVFLEEETEEGDVHEFLLDADEIHKPTFADTILVRLPLWCYMKASGLVLGKPATPPHLSHDEKVGANGDTANGDGILDGVLGDGEKEGEKAISSAAAANANMESQRRKGKRTRRS